VEVLELLRGLGQWHILQHAESLPLDKRLQFVEDLNGLDIVTAFSILRDENKRGGEWESLYPPSVLQRDGQSDANARRIGERALSENKLAVLLVAGGQGTRLGFSGPKGAYPVTPVMGKSPFQLFAERVSWLSRRYKCRLPFLIMTSDETHEETVRFFEDRGFFGLEEMVSFMRQDSMPVLTSQGKLALKDETHIARSPNGHGGALQALKRYGFVDLLLDEGFEHLFYFQVDNPLVQIGDPVFFGYHLIEQACVSTKVVRRRHMEEKVGLYVRTEKGDRIVEYMEKDERLNAMDEKGGPLFWAGNTAIHIFSLRFLKRVIDEGVELPYHLVERTMEIYEPATGLRPERVLKCERFIFDLIPYAERTCVVETKREEEFSPIKNASGEDSPDEARRSMLNLYRRRLREAGLEIPDGLIVEVDPSLLFDPQELRKAVRVIEITSPLYIGRP